MADRVAKPELYKNVAVRPPTMEDLNDIAKSFGMQCVEHELSGIKEYMCGILKSYERVDEMVAPALPVKYPRTPGHRPEQEDNKYNAWYQKCDIEGAPEGLLKGKRVAIKDNVCVAGVPMCNGSRVMDEFVPDIDATVVTRILDAGGRIVGKAGCEDLCFSASSWTNDTGPVFNPHDPARAAGGSSSGSAVVVQIGEADMALGGDQGGSVRMPASWCGIVGLKPTWGLVPYTGAVPMEITIDHLGPMAKTVTDCALFLEAIAGYDDGKDTRQPRDLRVPRYSQLMTGEITGKKIGLVTEGFVHCDDGVQKVVRDAANSLTRAGAVVEEFSLPAHDDAFDAWGVICYDGGYKCLVEGNGAGYNYKGFFSTAIIEKLRSGYKTNADNLSDTVKLFMLTAGYITQKYGNKFYAKAQNLNMKVTEEYNKALDKYDVLLMPTMPYVAPLLPTTDAHIADRLKNALGSVKNCAPFNATGHPALTINAGFCDKLPVGMMIVGKHFDEVNVLQVARAYEKLRDGDIGE